MMHCCKTTNVDTSARSRVVPEQRPGYYDCRD